MKGNVEHAARSYVNSRLDIVEGASKFILDLNVNEAVGIGLLLRFDVLPDQTRG